MHRLTNPADRNFKSAETVVMFSYTANIHLVLKQLFLCVIINGADRFLKKKKKPTHIIQNILIHEWFEGVQKIHYVLVTVKWIWRM